MIILNIFILILILLIFLNAVYLFILIMPRCRNTSDYRLFTSYAHRGLHGNGIPENSLEAFRKAVDKGYGIELDVQLSKDGVVMVFHDYTLTRMTGVENKLCQLKAEELQKLSLAGTDQTIPTFAQVLESVAGSVPLLVELKGENLDTSLCKKVADQLAEYRGPYCIESFNPLLIRAMKKHLPKAYYGQLYTNVCRDKNKKSTLNILLTLMALNVVSRPDFIAYNKADRKSFPVKVTTKFYNATKFVWTVKGQEEMETAHQYGEYPIFEINE